MRTTTSLVMLLVLCACSSRAERQPDESPANLAHPQDDEFITFGVVPQQSASRLARQWVPILDHLGARAGVTLRFRTAPNFAEFERRLASGAYDIAYMNPYHYITFHESVGYEALVKAKDKRIHGIIVVSEDAPMVELRELDGHVMAFPSPDAFAASILLRAHIRRQGWTIHPKYVSSHDSVYRTVAQGLYPAGGGVMRTFNAVEGDVHDRLRVLWATDGYTPHAIAAHPRMARSSRDALVRAMIALSDERAGQRMLDTLAIKGFEVAHNAEWDDVRALDLPTPFRKAGGDP